MGSPVNAEPGATVRHMKQQDDRRARPRHGGAIARAPAAWPDVAVDLQFGVDPPALTGAMNELCAPSVC